MVKVTGQADAGIEPTLVDQGGLCPTCGYFAGPLLSCPRCGARVEKRISVRTVKVLSVAGSLLGVALLWIGAALKQPKQVPVESLDERMNGAFIKVAGRVVSYVEDVPRNTLRLQVDDGTGKITVYAFNKLSQFRKVHEGRLPALGDEVELAGTVSETQKYGIALFLPVPERFRIVKRLEVRTRPLSEITAEMAGEFAQIRVFVSAYEQRQTRGGGLIHAFTLSDVTGSIPMVVFDKDMEKLPPATKALLFEKNAELELPVQISDYKGVHQASLIDASKVRQVGSVSPEEIQEKLRAKREQTTRHNKFRQLKKKDVGESYLFRARVTRIKKLAKGLALTLDDGTGEMPVVLWDTFRDKVKGHKSLAEGSRLTGILQVGEYRGELQLKVNAPEDVRIEKAAPGKEDDGGLEIIQEAPAPRGQEKPLPDEEGDISIDLDEEP